MVLLAAPQGLALPVFQRGPRLRLPLVQLGEKLQARLTDLLPNTGS